MYNVLALLLKFKIVGNRGNSIKPLVIIKKKFNGELCWYLKLF